MYDAGALIGALCELARLAALDMLQQLLQAGAALLEAVFLVQLQKPVWL